MGPIQDEIDKIKSTKKETQKAITEKHVEQPENPFKSYPEGIRQINEDVEQTKVVQDVFGKTTSPCGELVSSNTNFFGGPVAIRLNSQTQVDNVTSKTYINGSSGLGYHQLFDKFVCGKARPVLNKTVTSPTTSMFINNSLLTEIRNRENLEEVGNYFLSGCSNVQTWEFPNLKKVGNYFAQNATIRAYRHYPYSSTDISLETGEPWWAHLTAPDFRSLTEVGDYFMTGAQTESWIDLTPLKKAGNYFLYNNRIAGLLILPEDCDFTTTTYPLRGFQYQCTIYVPENWRLPINNYTLSAQSSSSPAYVDGINICGPGADSLIAALPNRYSSPYRKLNKVNLLLPEDGDNRYSPTNYYNEKNCRATSTLGALVPSFDYMGNWYPYRVVNEILVDKYGHSKPYCPSLLMAEYVFTCQTYWYNYTTRQTERTSTNGLTKWGNIISPRIDKFASPLSGYVITYNNNANYWYPDIDHSSLDNENYGPINFKHIYGGYWGDSLGDLYGTEVTYKNENINLPDSFTINALGRRSSNRINYEVGGSVPYSPGGQLYQSIGAYSSQPISYTDVYKNSNSQVPEEYQDVYKEMWLDYDHSWFGQGSGIPNTGSNGSNSRRVCKDRLGNAREYWLMDSASTSQKYYVTTSGSVSTRSITSTAYLRPILY